MPLAFSQRPQTATEPLDVIAEAGRIKMLGKRGDSGRKLSHLATRIFNVPLLIHPAKADVILNVLGPRLGIAAESLPVAAYYDEEEGDDIGYQVADKIAVVSIHGVLVKRASGMDALSGMKSYESIAKDLQSALENDDVQGILLDIDSPGGESSGMFDLADAIFSARGTKPVVAIANDSAYSAAYALASAADAVYVTREGGVGSIGAYMLHVDQSGHDKQAGRSYKYIFAGARKVDANPHAPLSSAALADLQAEVNFCRDMFVTLVARNRNCTAQQILDLEARCLSMGSTPGPIPLLADKVGNLLTAKTELMTKLGIGWDDDNEPPCDPDDPDCPVDDLSAKTISIPAALTSAAVSTGQITYSDATGKVHVIPVGDVFSMPTTGLVTVNSFVPIVDVQKEAETFLAEVPAAGEGQWLSVNAMFKAAAGSGYASAEKAGPKKASLELRCGAPGQKSSAAADSRVITCCVAPYDQPSQDMGGFVEVYSRGCFKKSLESGDDARVLFNHNSDMVLGRRSAGTAKFFDRADGLYFEVEAPETQWAEDLLTSMRRGDISGGSCAFFMKARWEYRSGQKTRVIEEARLVEGSVASFPIYESSTASVVQDPSPTTMHEVTEFDRARLEVLALR